MAIKLGEPVDLTPSKRYYQFNRGHAIRDVFDALVELITNSDDSYLHLLQRGVSSLEEGARVLIEHCDQRKGQPAIIRVHDRAEGMTLQEMREKLADVGTKRSAKGDRGFMSRGLKDCTALGSVIVESIRDERYYKCQLNVQAQFIPVADRKVTPADRKRLRIPRRNGTVVSLELAPEHKLPRFDRIGRDLPWHYALRDIISTNSPTQVYLRRELRRDEKPERLTRDDPEGKLVVDEEFLVPEYPQASARLKIWRADKPFESDHTRFQEYGLIVKGERAIHECSLLYPEFERDQNGRRYFGRLECPYMDHLLDEYDECLQSGSPPPISNPRLLIDPNRQDGVCRDHPFTKSLFQIPAERLRALLAKDREAEQPRESEISSQETRSRLDRLGKLASKFLQEQLEELQEFTEDDDHRDDESITQLGMVLYPPFVRIAVDEERSLTCYVNGAATDNVDVMVRIEVDEPSALSVMTPEILLRRHRTRENVLTGTIQIRGNAVSDAVIISAHASNFQKAETLAEVVETSIEEHEFVQPLEFERERYVVREGKQKSLWLYAKYPEVVSQETDVEVITSNSNSLPIRGRSRLIPVTGTNFARGAVIVQARRLTQKTVLIQAKVHGRDAETNVRVIADKEEGPKIHIELRDEDYGNFRAQWADKESRPNLLLISARHDSLKRYLGPGPKFEGQSTPHFRILLAEIVAESVCRKALGLETKERPWEFNWAGLSAHDTANSVLAALHKRLRQLVAEAHAIMLGERELRKIPLDGNSI